MNKEKKQTKPKILILIIFLVATLSLIQFILSHRLSTLGERYRFLEEKAKNLEEDNRILSEEISKIASLRNIASRAEELGLVKTTAVLHLTPQIPVALK